MSLQTLNRNIFYTPPSPSLKESPLVRDNSLSRTERASLLLAAQVDDPAHWPVYQSAFDWSMDLFEVSRYFPAEEKYALADPLRKASRCVCVHLADAWRYRDQPDEFVFHLAQADASNAEARVWLDFAVRCRYITDEGWRTLHQQSADLSRLFRQFQQPD
ncbi:MAG: four helix bundle protein [Bacteroidetes bacterium]|nr:four helix bundle protein [Bacteroidota bacterium]